jgi:hypothetical protein
MRGLITASECLNNLSRCFDYRFNFTDEEQSLGIISSVSAELFADSNPENENVNSPKSKPLGLLAEQLTIHFSGIEDPETCCLGFNLIFAFPHLNVYGKIEEMYLKLKKEAIRIDTVGNGD